jgi:putative methionine-R-sulfoxide reductase with GAF domain
MLTGHRDRATDLAAMDAGATDFLLKGKTDAALLDRTLRYAISQSAMASALERSRNQLAGLEEIGRILVEDGPTPATIARVVDLIVERFFARQIAIYLVDGDTLQLAGQHGYEHPLQSLSRFDASVDHVVRAHQPVFVPSLSLAPGVRDAGRAVASELSVPLIVAGELAGLLNVASPAAEPIGERDFSAIRLVAERLTAALKIMHEQRTADERLSEARRQLRGGPPTAQQGLIDGETLAYRRPLLEPLLGLAIASAGAPPDQSLGMLLVACGDAHPDTVARLADQVRTAFAHRPCVRFGEAQLAVLVAATDAAVVRSEGGHLVALAQAAGFEAWCGYASLAPGEGARDLIAAAEAALEYARRVGPRAVVG